MKYSLQKRISAFVLAFALVMTTAFNSIGATTEANAAAKVTKLYLTKKVTSATVGDTFKAQWAVKATKATKAMAKVTVKSDNPSVVKVTKTTQAKKAGKTATKAKKTKGTATLSAVGAGEAKITITTVKKTKKKKKLSKSFTVNVAAKETPASSETPVTPSGDASKDPVKTVESLNVAASNGTTIGETEQTTLTVTSGTEGAAINNSSVKFESENPAILSVDAKGVVTGLKAGTANVIVTATDLTGKVLTKKVAIVVTELLNATITVPADQKAITMKVNTSVKLTPSVTPATLQSALTFTSSAPDVIAVSADGTITALKAGTGTTITIHAKGADSKGDVVIPVTSVADGYGIASFNAVKANQFKLEFTTPVSVEDQKRLNVSLKLSDEVSKTVSFDATGSYALLTSTASTFTAGKYTVEISGTGLVFGDVKVATATLDAPAAKSIKIVEKTYAPGSAVKVAYQVLDQYGDAFKSYPANKLNWTLAYKDPSIKTNDVDIDTTDGTGKAYDGYVIINMLPEILTVRGFNTDLKTAFDKDPTAVLGFTLTGYDPTTPSIQGSGVVSLKKLIIDTVKIIGVASSDGKTAVGPSVSVSNTDVKTYLLVSAKSGDLDVDWTAYKEGGYANAINFSVTANDIIPGTGAGKFDPASIDDNGRIPFTMTASKTGKLTFNSFVSTTAGNKVDTFAFEVTAASYAKEIVWPNGMSVRAGSNQEFTVTYLDQYGKAIKPSVKPTNFTFNFSGVSGLDPNGTAADKITAEFTAVDKIKFTVGKNIKAGTAVVSTTDTTSGTLQKNNGSITVTDIATVSGVSTDASKKFKSFNASDMTATVDLLVGEEVTFNVYGVDQDKKLLATAASGFKYTLEYSETNNTNITHSPVAVGLTQNAATAIASASYKPFNGTDTVNSVAFSFTGNKKIDGATATLKVYDAATGKTLLGTFTLTINVVTTPDTFAANISAKSYKAKDLVAVELTANDFKGNKVAFNGTGVVTLAEVANNASSANKTASAWTAKSPITNQTSMTGLTDGKKTATVKFTNGVGTAYIEADKASTDKDHFNVYAGYVELNNGYVYGANANGSISQTGGTKTDKNANVKIGLTADDGEGTASNMQIGTDPAFTSKLFAAYVNVTASAEKRLAITSAAVSTAPAFTVYDENDNALTLDDKSIVAVQIYEDEAGKTPLNNKNYLINYDSGKGALTLAANGTSLTEINADAAGKYIGLKYGNAPEKIALIAGVADPSVAANAAIAADAAAISSLAVSNATAAFELPTAANGCTITYTVTTPGTKVTAGGTSAGPVTIDLNDSTHTDTVITASISKASGNTVVKTITIKDGNANTNYTVTVS